MAKQTEWLSFSWEDSTSLEEALCHERKRADGENLCDVAAICAAVCQNARTTHSPSLLAVFREMTKLHRIFAVAAENELSVVGRTVEPVTNFNRIKLTL